CHIHAQITIYNKHLQHVKMKIDPSNILLVTKGTPRYYMYMKLATCARKLQFMWFATILATTLKAVEGNDKPIVYQFYRRGLFLYKVIYPKPFIVTFLVFGVDIPAKLKIETSVFFFEEETSAINTVT
ncbi:hypothetical protein ACJX0J_016176, partial [Zea mays]